MGNENNNQRQNKPEWLYRAFIYIGKCRVSKRYKNTHFFRKHRIELIFIAMLKNLNKCPMKIALFFISFRHFDNLRVFLPIDFGGA